MNKRRRPPGARRIAAACLAACAVASAAATDFDGGLGERVARNAGPLHLPPEVQRVADLVYGPAARERFDVYLPAPAARVPNAPVILMVHGGAWMIGNKAMPPVVENKLAHWSPRGIVFVSMNYPLVPQATPAEQADAVARALAAVQRLAPSWGADPARVVLMGHSAGAHLVALVGASPAIARRAGAQPWLGTVALDSAALNLTGLMRGQHPRFYDRAFGTDPAGWPAASPVDNLAVGAPPLLLVCSTLRSDDSCGQSAAHARRAVALGLRATVSEQALTHAEINATLGLPGPYTDTVDAFLRSVGI